LRCCEIVIFVLFISIETGGPTNDSFVFEGSATIGFVSTMTNTVFGNMSITVLCDTDDSTCGNSLTGCEKYDSLADKSMGKHATKDKLINKRNRLFIYIIYRVYLFLNDNNN
jgi:hypothetical protein